jgi:hypothetical protein
MYHVSFFAEDRSFQRNPTDCSFPDYGEGKEFSFTILEINQEKFVSKLAVWTIKIFIAII